MLAGEASARRVRGYSMGRAGWEVMAAPSSGHRFSRRGHRAVLRRYRGAPCTRCGRALACRCAKSACGRVINLPHPGRRWTSNL